MRRVGFLLGILSAIVVSLASVGSSTGLMDALRAIPAGVNDWMVFYTDWSQIKENLGLGFLTSSSPIELRIEMGLRLSEDQAAASAYAISWLRIHAEEWGWDSADLQWEANIVSDQWPPVYLLRFRDGFDFAPVISHFIERGFTQTVSQGVTVYSHDLRPDAAWIRTTELSILNTALLQEESMLLLTSSPAALDEALTTWMGSAPSAASDPFAAAAVRHLGQPTSAILLRGLGECQRFTPLPILDLVGGIPSEKQIDDIKERIENATLLVPYRALGVGYQERDGQATGTVVLEYDHPDLAEADRAARCLLASEGMSLRSERPLSETYFSLSSCETQDRSIVMTVVPLDSRPQLLFRMIYVLDAVFAACSATVP